MKKIKQLIDLDLARRAISRQHAPRLLPLISLRRHPRSGPSLPACKAPGDAPARSAALRAPRSDRPRQTLPAP